MKKVGTLLKETRESQGLTIEQVAQKTKIHAHKLSAIENSDYKTLPAKVFVKGLIRSYARELKLDEKMIQDLCDQEFDEKEEPPHTPIVSSPHIEDEEGEKKLVGRFQAPNSFFLVVGVFVTVVLIGFIYATVAKIQSYTKEESTHLSVEIPQTEETTEGSEQSEGISADLTETPSIEETKPQSNNGSAQEKPSIKEVSAEQKNKLEESPKKVEPKVEEKVEKEPEAVEATPEKTQDTTVYSDNKLVIEALEAIRVEILWSDGQTQVLLLKDKEVKTLIFSNPLKIRINNGGAVNITFNNKSIGVPGSLNKPIELQYP